MLENPYRLIRIALEKEWTYEHCGFMPILII